MWFQGHPITIFSGRERCYLPRWLYPDDDVLPGYRTVHRCASLVDFCRQQRPPSLALYRSYALGDILMLMPLARALYRVCQLRRPVLMIVGHRHLEQLAPIARGDPVLEFAAAFGPRDYGCGVHLFLDGVLEADHRGGPESDVHRMDLYARAIGLALPQSGICA